jgi:hypothetical protein
MKLDVEASPVQSLKCGLVLVDKQGYDNFAVARVGAIFDQGDVTVADVLVDHRIAFDLQSIDSFRSHPAEQETRHRNCLVTFNYIERRASGYPSQ